MRRTLLIGVCLVVLIAAAGCSSSSSTAAKQTTGTTSAAAGSPIGHVFVINLENKDYDETWGPSSVATYLNGTLRPQGQLLEQYYGIGHFSLDN